ncbi:MAG: DUF1343 domain-containing protein [Thermoanaerobaculia bacterium]
MIATGLDRLLEAPSRLAGRRYGVLSHSASVTSDLQPIHLALQRSQCPAPSLLFGPEHGFYGIEQDMVPSRTEPDPWTGLPVISLYGDCEDSLRPDPALFADIDLLVIDFQDVGARYYTYGATAVWASEAALKAGCEVLILDRPNPLGGVEVEGNMRRPGFESFVGAFEIPVRHGLTLGEIVRLEAKRRKWDDGVSVLEMEGWKRDMTWQNVGRAWIPPSPNIPNLQGAWIFPGGCLVEATELSEGRGTTRPFQLIGGAGIDPVGLADHLSRLELRGVTFTPTYFRPQFQKQAHQECGGVQITVTASSLFRPFRFGVELLWALRTVAPEQFEWRRAAYEFVSDRPTIDLLSGDSALREAFDAGCRPDDWIASWADDEKAFREERREILLYPEPQAGDLL